VVNLETLGMRERILEMGTRLFVSQGYDGISMREIADACGISKAGLYYHFKDKEDLFLAILSENLGELSTIINELESQPASTRERVSQFVRAVFIRLPPDHRAIIRLAGQELDKVRPELRVGFDRKYNEQFVGRLAGWLALGIQSGELRQVDPQLAVWALLGLMYPFFNPKHPTQEEKTEQIAGFIETVFFEGVGRHD
jgi:AcrR family transcriptional regulator